jgi:PAS domain S-box-containing protein
MKNSGDKLRNLTRGVDDLHKPQRILYAGLLVAAGIILAGLQLPHLVADIQEEMGLLALTTGAIMPLILGLVIAWSGYKLWQSDLPVDKMRRVTVWFVLGAAGMTVVSGALIIYQFLEGALLSHSDYLLLDFATAGGIAGILVGWYDAQNQRRTEHLRIFQKAAEHGGHCFYLTAPDGTIEYVNSEFETQTGYTEEEAVGRNPRILKSGEQDEEFYEEMWETILAGDVWQAELVNQRKDGTRLCVDQTIAPVMDSQNKINHFVAINRDITERKEQEIELERQNERLDDFASVVSHDLRNPLNVALLRIDLARNDCDSEHLDVADGALERMERLIDDVLALARQGETIDDVEPVSLQSVSEDAWAQIKTNDADISVKNDQSIDADRSRLQQLFENLFRNAIEHGGEDVRIKIGTCGGGFYVEDTGEGIPDEARENLFESGYTTSEEGTGLGLAIVQRIVNAHGWEISATEGDEGARFEITGISNPIDISVTQSGTSEIK